VKIPSNGCKSDFIIACKLHRSLFKLPSKIAPGIISKKVVDQTG
jgi:hypothetical protein